MNLEDDNTEQNGNNLLEENKLLKNRILALENELTLNKEHLKRYTAPDRSKTYYENHKEELLAKMKENPRSAEKIKEKNRKSYLKRKERLEQEKLEQEKLEQEKLEQEKLEEI